MAETTRARCICATVDYRSPAWSADYFPEECPEEWRLAYYMNDFQGVYLPVNSWSEAGQLAMISAELEGYFELILEWPASMSVDKATALLDELRPIADHIASLVVKLDAEGLDSYLPLLRILQDRFPISLRSQQAIDAAQSARIRQLGFGQVWTPANPFEFAAVEDYLVAVVPVMGLREIRPVLESMTDMIERGVEVGLFMEEESGAPQRAKEVRTLLELLELA